MCVCDVLPSTLLVSRCDPGKYPEESYFDAFLNSNGGGSNAYTSDEVSERRTGRAIDFLFIAHSSCVKYIEAAKRVGVVECACRASHLLWPPFPVPRPRSSH